MPMPPLRPALALLPVLFAAAAHGQTASLARDINATGPGEGGSPSAFYAAPGKLFVFGAQGIWVTDGTSSSTVLLADPCPSPGCSALNRFLGDLGGTVLWVTETSELSLQLWRSDGTRPGTYPLTGPDTGLARPDLSSDPDDLYHAFFKGFFYFRACDPDGCRSYRSDGSAAGTVEIPRLGIELMPVGDRLFSHGFEETGGYALRVTGDPAAGSTVLKQFTSSGIARLTAAGNKLFFTAPEGLRPEQLWVSDGTAAGTRALTQFTSRTPFDPVRRFTPAGNRVYFVAGDGSHGEEIWVSDGTPLGTRRVTSFKFGSPFPYLSGSMEEVNGRLVFGAYDGKENGLWATAGTPDSAVLLPVELAHGTPPLQRSGGRVFFRASDPKHGDELWVTDGTPAGTRMVADIHPGPLSSLRYEAQVIPWPGGVLLMGADDGVHGQEIWLSDGTAAGTRRATELEDDFAVQDIYFVPPVSFAGRIWFATDGFFKEGGLWTTDGTPAGTRLFAHLGRAEPAADPKPLTAAGGRLYFSAHDGAVHGLWSTLGPPESTVLVQEAISQPSSGGEIRGASAAGSLVFFWQSAIPLGPEEQLWRTDGTPAGTFLLRSAPGFPPGGGVTFEGAGFQGRFYFPELAELWSSDGTVAGTALFFSLPRDVANLTVAGGALHFTSGDEVWRSDGTAAGTRRLATLPGIANTPVPFAGSGPSVFFAAAGELWKTDGTPAGTEEVDQPGFGPRSLTPFQGGIAYFATFQFKSALFVSDGTAAGTVLAGTPSADRHGQEPPGDLAVLGGRLYFPAWDGARGVELWTSDGTADSVELFREILPGWRSSSPRRLTAAGGRLFFTASDGVRGSELWVSDGTAAGTRMVQDLNPYAASSEPDRLTIVGDRLYFTADDGITGRELWSYPLNAGPGCQPASTRLCLGQGRFQAEAAWRDFEGRRGTGQAVALTADTGWFWFFDPANVEAVLKVLDGRGLNQHHWVFYGALSSVEYSLTVTDTQTGASRRYSNPPGQLASVGDTQGFGPLGAFSRKGRPEGPVPLTRIASRLDPAAAAGACQPTAERLCLNGGRFAVEASWKDFQGNEGTGKAVGLTADTGWFWFFSETNVEVMIKVLDGTGLNGRHWVFYGALSNVEYTLTVTDTQTGQENTYRNPLGHFGSVADTEAF